MQSKEKKSEILDFFLLEAFWKKVEENWALSLP
jgi:hypothetical protein